MTRSSSPTATVPLLAAFAHDATERAGKSAADVAEATTRYWATIDRLASGDASGGVSRKDFADILETLGLGFDIDRAHRDVEQVQRIRDTQAQLVEAEANKLAAEAASNEAYATLLRAKDAAEHARIMHERASWTASEAVSEASRLRVLIRDELRDVERNLRRDGFAGNLLAPPPPARPKRRWRFRNGNDASRYANPPGQHLDHGSEVDMPGEFAGLGVDGCGVEWATLVGTCTPDMPPPRQVPLKVVPIGERDPSSPASFSTDASVAVPLPMPRS